MYGKDLNIRWQQKMKKLGPLPIFSLSVSSDRDESEGKKGKQESGKVRVGRDIVE